MSLYYDAATILTSSEQRGSLKSLIYAKDSRFKSKAAHLYALISETAKHDTFLKEVVQNAGILALEPKLTPLLSILLVHDHFFTKNGIAAASTHPLRQSIEKHKARLQSEFTRARLRRRAANVGDLKTQLAVEKGKTAKLSPRWARVNTIQTNLKRVIYKSFASYKRVDSIHELVEAGTGQDVFFIDNDIPGLIAFRPEKDLTKTQAYNDGDIILQDKASCFPAYLLLGNSTPHETADIIDGCAAPGNKTTHAAAIVIESELSSTIYACERDLIRSKTLQMMVDKAGASKLVTVLQKQDFLALDPYDERFRNVTHLLLDPSCSGSGILGREDIPVLDLPEDPRRKAMPTNTDQTTDSKKRKRGLQQRASISVAPAAEVEDEVKSAEQPTITIDKPRLEKLSSLQSLIVEHAFRFPAAIRVTYSTCSIHVEENEAVVERVLRSDIGRSRGWQTLKGSEQVDGMKRWIHRGLEAVEDAEGKRTHNLSREEVDACIRCYPHEGQGTMGFFLCGFVRDLDEGQDQDQGQDQIADEDSASRQVRVGDIGTAPDDDSQEEWEGFSDD